MATKKTTTKKTTKTSKFFVETVGEVFTFDTLEEAQEKVAQTPGSFLKEDEGTVETTA